MATTVTIPIAVSGDDSNLWRTGATYPPVTTIGDPQPANTFLDVSKDTGFQTNIMFLNFDTSSIPEDATVTAASLLIHLDSTANTNNKNVNFEWYPWTTAPNKTTDWADVVGTTAASPTVASLTGGPTVISITLSNAGANVNKTGFTGIRFGLSGGQPTGANEVFFAAWDHATAQAPWLQVTYELGYPVAWFTA